MDWYITKYARLHNGEVELISYTKAPNLAYACGAECINLPNDQFYQAECIIGSLLPKFKPYWVARERYSHKPHIAQMQVEAELKAQYLIDAKDVDFALMTREMQILKPLLTQAQFDVTFNALKRKPSVMKYLYERSEC